jgi:hypothetical protein
MKQIIKISAITITSLFFFLNISFAQDSHYFTVTTWKMTVPEDGSNKELNELFKEWYEKVVSKNDKILSERVLRHSNGSDSRDWVIITEYASWNDIEAADEIQSKLVKEGWATKEERQKYFKTFGKYGNMHSDEIYRSVKGLTK